MTEALLKRTESDHYPVHVTAALPTLGDSVTSYSAYHHVGMQPGTHLGLPSPSITVVLGIGAPTHIVATPGGDQAPSLFMAMVGGFHMGPVVIGYDNEMCGIQLELTPQAARRVFRMPASQLAHRVLDLDDILGPASTELVDRIHAAPTGSRRLMAVDDVLSRHLGSAHAACPHVDHAWRLLVESHGAVPVADVADAVGWSRRHLDREFVAEFGVTPKDVARLARFTAAREVVQRTQHPNLAELSATCGYFDQAHMAREWNLLASIPASAWWAKEGVQFFQANAGAGTAS
jgi:AraC-like DNA-binding protein